jgi:voltage-gated sodium channel
VVKLVAEGRRPLHYFADNWNKFDFFIVAACYVFFAPALAGMRSMVSMLRLLRLLRVLKLVKALPQLRIIIEALISGFGSISFVTVILFIFFYLYANIGMMFFLRNDPAHWCNLQTALTTLFRLATLDGYSDLVCVSVFLLLFYFPFSNIKH